MKMNLYKIGIRTLLGTVILPALLTACDDDNRSDLQLDGETRITRIALDNYEGTIDYQARSITVALPEIYNDKAMTVTSLLLSEKAEANIKEGDVINCSISQMIRVTNGNTYMDYRLSVKHDEARILSFRLNDTYVGVIDETNHNITVRVPGTVDVTNLTPTITTSEGATVVPASGNGLDFSQPVDFIVSYRTASYVYTVKVIVSDIPDAVYVGLAATMDDLNPEEKEAVTWMMNNVPNAQYISFEDVQAGRVNLERCKLMWWHLHIDGGIDSMSKFEQAAPSAINALVKIKELYNDGMPILLTRYATFYAAKLGATADGNAPNNCWGQSEALGEITGGPWNFFIQGHESHPIYQGLTLNNGETDKVYTCDTGYRITNSTAQWHIGSDWGGYADYDTWRNGHGGIDLGYGGDGAVVVWEYPANGNRGGILCIGSGCYDWYADGVDTSADRFHGNVGKLTMNAINYLTEQ